MATFRIPINLTWAGAGGPGVNIWHARASGVTDAEAASSLQGAVDAIHTFYSTIMSTSGLTSGRPMVTGMVASLGTVVDIDTQEEKTPTFTSITCNSTAGNAPMAAALVVGWRTSIAARRGRGRTFLGPCTSMAVAADGTPTDAVLGTVGPAAQALVDASTAQNLWGIGVYGQESALTGPNVTPAQRVAAPHVLRDITGFKIRDTFAVLRSRRD